MCQPRSRNNVESKDSDGGKVSAKANYAVAELPHMNEIDKITRTTMKMILVMFTCLLSTSCTYRSAQLARPFHHSEDAARRIDQMLYFSGDGYDQYICPHCVIVTVSLGRSPSPVLTFSMTLIISVPSITLPKTTCLLSRCGVWTVVMKN